MIDIVSYPRIFLAPLTLKKNYQTSKPLLLKVFGFILLIFLLTHFTNEVQVSFSAMYGF